MSFIVIAEGSRVQILSTPGNVRQIETEIYGAVMPREFIHKHPDIPRLYLIQEEGESEKEWYLYEHEFLVL